jgi:nucleoside-diphosphate-sugar epimerase
MEKILLTGAAGFIGSKTAEKLLKQQIEVIGIDNLNDYYDVSLKNHRLKKLKSYDKFRFYQQDIEDLAGLDKLFHEHNFDAVVNLAARAGVRYSTINPHIYMTTNAHGTLNLLEMMRKYGVKKKVMASTSSLYAGLPMPFVETLPVNTPISPYAASKKAAEMMCFTYHQLFGIDVTITRYFTVYGEASRPDMACFRFIKWIAEGKPLKLFGDGSQARDFTHVDDIAEGTVKGLKNVGYEVINLGGGENPISMNYMINQIEKHLGKKADIEYLPFHKADVKVTWANIEKAKKILDWQPKIKFEEGLERAVKWYLENQNWVQKIDCKQ